LSKEITLIVRHWHHNFLT